MSICELLEFLPEGAIRPEPAQISLSRQRQGLPTICGQLQEVFVAMAGLLTILKICCDGWIDGPQGGRVAQHPVADRRSVTETHASRNGFGNLRKSAFQAELLRLPAQPLLQAIEQGHGQGVAPRPRHEAVRP